RVGHDDGGQIMAFVEPSATPTPLLLDQYERLHALLDEITRTRSGDCSETQLLEAAIQHERAERRMLAIFTDTMVEIEERSAYRHAGCQNITKFLIHQLGRHGEANRLANRVWALGRFHDL